MDKLEISNNCNSYYLHDDFLLLTDHTNILKFVQMGKLNNLSSYVSQQMALLNNS